LGRQEDVVLASATAACHAPSSVPLRDCNAEPPKGAPPYCQLVHCTRGFVLWTPHLPLYSFPPFLLPLSLPPLSHPTTPTPPPHYTAAASSDDLNPNPPPLLPPGVLAEGGGGREAREEDEPQAITKLEQNMSDLQVKEGEEGMEEGEGGDFPSASPERGGQGGRGGGGEARTFKGT